MKQPMKKSHMEGLLVLALFGVFTACILAVLLTGAGAYRHLAERDDAAYDRRTALQYAAAKVRQAEDVTVERFGDADALVLAEQLGGERYETRVYCCGGYLRELFAQHGAELEPEDGEQVLKAEALRASLGEDRLLRVEVLTGGRWETVVLCLRSGEERAA